MFQNYLSLLIHLTHSDRPAIGGYFSRPAEQFPDVFGNNEFMKKYPYFLACSIPATFSVLAWLVTLMFLKEVRNICQQGLQAADIM